MELEFMLTPIEEVFSNFQAPVAEQVSTFRQDFFENFLLRGDEELPTLLYGRKNFPTPDGDRDCLFVSILPFKEMVPPVIEMLLGAGAEWVMQVSEVYVYEGNPDGTKKDHNAANEEAVLFAAYAPGWQELAMHYFHRPVLGDMPEPIGDWQIHDNSVVKGALVPFSDGHKGH
jgi:hypothetical protein